MHVCVCVCVCNRHNERILGEESVYNEETQVARGGVGQAREKLENSGCSVSGYTWNSVTKSGNWNCEKMSLFMSVRVNEVSR